jgi:nucleoside-diphosphate-sugar epimerase
VPVGVLESLSSLVGKRAAVDRLCGNLQLDISKAREILNWEPPHSLAEGLQRAFAGVME